MENNYKICVYAICKNEEKFVDRWYNSMKEADYIVVLDTGSTDNTVEKLAALPNVIVQQKNYDFFRFDIARNDSMKLIPNDTDICVCTDLDEILQEGWAAKLRQNWHKGLNRVKYTYIWSFQDNGKPGVMFEYEKIHSLHDFKWDHAVHEVLKKITPGEEQFVRCRDIVLEHHPDPTKSRGNYLALLELDVQEKPEDDRARHYYARELMYHKEYEKAIEQFKIHLSMPTSIWEPERCASMRYIAACSQDLNEKEKWLNKAIAEAPYLREPYIEMAFLQYMIKNWYGVIYFINRALLIKENQLIYTNNPNSWNEKPYDLLAVAYWNVGNFENSLQAINIACEYNPKDERLIKNKEIIEKSLQSSYK